MVSNVTKRIRLISFAIVAVALLLILKLYFVQIVFGSAYAEKGDRQYARPENDLYNRGSIYFSNKDGSLFGAGILKTGFILALSPKNVVSAENAFKLINVLYPLEHDSFVARAQKKDDPYEEIGKHLDEKVGLAIDELKIPGVHLYKEKWRYYPGDVLASQTLGFVGFGKGDILDGKYGLEKYYEDTLKRAHPDLYVNSFAEIFKGVRKITGGEREGDLVTTIEPEVQAFLENEISTIEKKYHSEVTGGVIIDPKTGEIKALAANPGFDPNTFQKEKDISVFSNPLIERVYEMGSIMKPITMAIGLDTEKVTAKTTYMDAGSVTLDGRKISNHDGKAHGTVSMQEVLNQSLNTGAAFVEQAVGNTTFREYLQKFGIGEETGIDLPNEVKGLTDNLKTGRDVEFATASFGQGIALTPIATVRALSILANGGIPETPHVVKEIRYTIGGKSEVTYPPDPPVIKKTSADEITRMLVEVVDKALLQGAIKMQHYSIAAKTGTAQIANPKGGGYYEDRFLHSFFGYMPAYNPKFLVFLYTVHPEGVEFASHTLTYPFQDIVKFLINYYEIPPDR